nr:hypothetical protein [Tanacetum cinerariifolium]
MIHETDLHCFYVHNDGYFSYLTLTYVDGVILEMAVQMMPYEEFVVYLEEKLNLCLDHLDIDLIEYLSQAITNEMDAYVFKKIGPPKKRYCNEFSIDEIVDWVEMEVENLKGVETSTRNIEKGINATDYVKVRTSTTNKGKETVSKDAIVVAETRRSVVETRRSSVEINTETKYDSDDDDSDYQLANREAKAKAKDNLVSEINEPNDANSTPANNVRGETFEEHDIYMIELLKSLNTADKDGITEDPFIFVEKHVERLTLITNNCRFWHVIPTGGNHFDVKLGSELFTVDEGQERKESDLYVRVVVQLESLRGLVRDEGAGGSRGGARGSKGRGGVVGSRGTAGGSGGGASVSRGVVGGSKGGSSMSGGASMSTGKGDGGSSGASGSRGRGVSGSSGASGSRGRGAGGSKRTVCQLLEHKKDKVRRRLGLLDFLNGLDCKMN